jgi:serine/threonine protein kinase/tetratricopeptide (TPR) repeat protein
MNERDIFIEALQQPSPADRRAYLEQACAGDECLLGRVEDLLAAHDKAGSFLHEPSAAAVATIDVPPPPRSLTSESEVPGSIIGPYKLLEQIGEGGMGTVFMADQTAPVRRRVALKIIKPGMDTRQVIARFEAERQALAMMDHPNIARVHDAGATESGRPFFVMELVRGIEVTEYCDRERLSIPERLDLFVLVCRAVQHAHQKGIIHRDLKPSNILVTVVDGAAVPKIIDFGVAKATGGRLTDLTLFTGFHQFVGTPLFMSPEQADLSGMDVDTRSDIYSLGVLLYELLTGTTPFDPETFRQAAFDEIRRIIREQEPPRPSTRLSTLRATRTTVSANRKANAQHLDRTVSGELDWIVMKALEKDRRRRYETANDFAADVMRYLTDQPVEACPPSVSYRLAKFARRNRAALTTAVVVSCALAGGTAVSVWQAVRAAGSERQAEARYKLARRAVDDMYTKFAEKVLGENPQLDPVQREFLEKALAYYQEFSAERGTATDLREETAKAFDRVGKIRHQLGYYEEATQAYHRASKLFNELNKAFPDRADFLHGLAESERGVGNSLKNLGQLSEAEQSLQRSVALFRQLTADHPAVPKYREGQARGEHCLAWILRQLAGRKTEMARAMDAAEKLLTELMKEVPGNPDYPDLLAEVCMEIGSRLKDDGRIQEAEAAYARSKELWERLRSQYPHRSEYARGLAQVLNNHGILMKDHLKREEAERYFRHAIELGKALVERSPDRISHCEALANPRLNLGVLLVDTDRFPEAEEQYRQALRLYEVLAAESLAVPGYRHAVGMLHANLGDLLCKSGRSAEGEHEFRRCLEMWEKLATDFSDHVEYRELLAKAHLKFAYFSYKEGKLEQLERSLNRAIEVCEALVATDPQSRQYQDLLAELYLRWAGTLQDAGKLEEAERFYRRSINVFEPLIGGGSPDPESQHLKLACALEGLGTAVERRGRTPEANKLNRRALVIKEKLAEDHPDRSEYLADAAGSLHNLANKLITETEYAEARQVLERAIRYQRAALARDPKREGCGLFLAAELRMLAECLIELGDHDGAARAIEECARSEANDHWNLYMLADLLSFTSVARLRNPDLALKLARKALELKPDDGMARQSLSLALYRTGDWKGCVEAGDGLDYFRAMAHWQLGQKDEARAAFEQADRWFAGYEQQEAERIKSRGEETHPGVRKLRRIRAEAAALLGLDSSSVEKLTAPKK